MTRSVSSWPAGFSDPQTAVVASLPLFSTLLQCTFAYCTTIPPIFNYSVKIPPSEAVRQSCRRLGKGSEPRMVNSGPQAGRYDR